jgi:hypothetical protein
MVFCLSSHIIVCAPGGRYPGASFAFSAAYRASGSVSHKRYCSSFASIKGAVVEFSPDHTVQARVIFDIFLAIGTTTTVVVREELGTPGNKHFAT